MTIPFSLRQLRYFSAAARTLSITEAARQLHISQPSVSTAISKLEDSLQTPLFVRHHAQGLSLTSAGRLLATEADALLKHAQDVHSTLREFSDAGAGSLSVGFLVTLAPTLMPLCLKGFLSRYSRATLTPSEGGQDFLLASLRSGLLDCVVTYDLGITDDVEFEPMLELPPHVLLPRTHELAARETIELSALAAFPMILLDLPLSREYFQSLFTDAGLVPNISYRSAHSDVVHAMVAEGFGFTLWNFPVHTVFGRTDLPIESRVLHPKARSIRLGLASAATTPKRKIVQTFADYCTAALATYPLDAHAAGGERTIDELHREF